ncbi:amino acid--tRNA ligase-related protein [Nocardia neocaledoniensis]|uniref:amino acid--tRNA ligase-related protein n=1 Tax=Nocardia neocaledoniensis TaxID=236511 RepID=UPI00245573FA|nr:amino acid--tRNA ligase-related protein [Nocardia neocaledoniensis]
MTDLRTILTARSTFYQVVRGVLTDAGAIEVKTPIACPHHDLAPMPQFLTTHPATGQSLYLRIAPEEHLTRLIARGGPAVFEISTNFRADTSDETHLAEFESVEALFPGWDVGRVARLVERLCRAADAAMAPWRPTSVPGWTADPSPFALVPVTDWVESEFGFARDRFSDPVSVAELAIKLGVDDVSAHTPLPKLADEIVGAIAGHFDGPVLLTSAPNYLGGPAKERAGDPGFLSRCELYYQGLELGSMADQVTDPEIIRTRYRDNYALKQQFGINSDPANEALLEDISNGMPDFAGLGIGFDRLLMLSLGYADVRSLHPFIYQ